VPAKGGREKTEAPKPTRLSSQSASPFIGVDRRRQGGARREGGRGELPTPHGLPGCNPCPAAARHYLMRSTLQRPLGCLRQSHARPLCPSSTTAPTTSRNLPARSAHGGRGFSTSAMDFTVAREKRGGAVETTRPPRLPPAHRLLHPRPRALPLASRTPRSPPPPDHQRGGGHLASEAVTHTMPARRPPIAMPRRQGRSHVRSLPPVPDPARAAPDPHLPAL
jgi:hypothetical protein